MRYLNIEVALGLAALGVVASRVLGTQLTTEWFIVVPLTCWAVYTMDRLFDSRDESTTPKTGRHAFHARNRVPLLVAAALALLVAASTAIMAFPLEYWYVAVALGGLTLMHLALQRTRSKMSALIKDLNVVLTYTMAAWAIPIVDSWSFDATSIAVLLATLTLVLADVVLLSRIDSKEDAGAGRPSIAAVLGDQMTGIVASILCLLALLLAYYVASKGDQALSIVLGIMALMYWVLSRTRFKDNDIARLALESVLVVPLILLLV